MGRTYWWPNGYKSTIVFYYNAAFSFTFVAVNIFNNKIGNCRHHYKHQINLLKPLQPTLFQISISIHLETLEVWFPKQQLIDMRKCVGDGTKRVAIAPVYLQRRGEREGVPVLLSCCSFANICKRLARLNNQQRKTLCGLFQLAARRSGRISLAPCS